MTYYKLNSFTMSKYSFVVLVMLITSFSASSQIFQSPHFLDWSQEPNYEGVTGYDENPYDSKRKSYAAIKLNVDQFQIQSNETFDTLWNNLGNPEYLNRPIFLHGGDPYDLENEGNFGLTWKAAHDGLNLYILMKYYDLNEIAAPYSRQIVIYTQPTDIIRHEPTYQAGVHNNNMAQKNLAYGRFIELGGSRFHFNQGMVDGFDAMQGITGNWGTNQVGLYSVIELNHYWDEEQQMIRGMIILPFDGALAYPVDPYFPEGDQVPLTEGSIIAFDIQGLGCNNPDWELEDCFNYAWSADNFMVYLSNYYVGHLEILPEKKYALSLNSNPIEGGTTTVSGEYSQGQTVSISAIANEGYVFKKWSKDDQVISIQANHVFPMPAEGISLTAQFSDKVPQIAYEPASVDQALISGETAIQNLVISNTGNNESELIVQISSYGTTGQDSTFRFTIYPTELTVTTEAPQNFAIGFNTENLIEGIYRDTLLLLTNDPEMTRVVIPVALSVTGIPEIGLSHNELDFGFLSTGATRTKSITFYNPGTADLAIENMEVDDSRFSLSFENTIIEPFASKKLNITFSSMETGVANSVLSVSTNVADQQNITVNLLAEVGDLVIRIIVTDNADNLIENAFVQLLENNSILAYTITNSDGEATFEHVYSSQYSFVITKDESDMATGSFTLTQESIDMTVILEPSPQMVFKGIDWVNWAMEPDYPETTGYADNPYNAKRKHYTAYKYPSEWIPVDDNSSFDQLWEIAGDPEWIRNNVTGNDMFDLGEGNTFGAEWKAIHDGTKLYVLIKSQDLSMQVYDWSRSFEIMAQPTSIVRHEYTFNAGVNANDTAMMNMAYGRYIELGGGKALFNQGYVNEYTAIEGQTGWWNQNNYGFEGLVNENHFWQHQNEIIKAVLVMSFDTVLSYPADPTNIYGQRIPLLENKTISFDIMSNSYTQNGEWVKYIWSSDRNNVYASNYYSGHLHVSSEDITATPKFLSLASSPPAGGTVAGDGTYGWGEEVTASATPEEGWKFVNWKKNGLVISRENPYTFNLYQDTELTGNFSDEWPEISVLPEIIEAALDTGDSTEIEILIANNGNIPLEFSISIESIAPGNKNQDYLKSEMLIDESFPQKGEKDFRVGTPVEKANGGPDDFGYRWSDSDEPNGPAFIWNSIENTGTLLNTVSGCDDCNQAVDLLFDFPYYGINYNKIWVDANGYVGFTNSWSSYWNQELPSFNAPPGIIAGYWMDLCPGCNTNGKVFFQNFDNMAIIQYQDVRLLSGSGSVTFQIQLYRSGEIRLLYQNVPTNQNYYTIGIQNHNSDMGITVAFNTPYLKNNHAIRIASTPNWIAIEPQTGTLAPGENQLITLLLDATGLADGVYESSLNIQSNDPESYLVTVPVTLNVTGYPAIELSDHTIDFGIWGLGRLLQFPLIITNPGGAALEITNIKTDHPGFSVPLTEMIVPPFESRILSLGFLAEEEITYEGTLTFITNVEDQESFSIPLKAEAIKLEALLTIKHNEDPLQGAAITIKQANNTIYTGITDETGSLLIENLYPGTFTYLITKDEFRNEEGTFVITDQSKEISVTLTEQYVRFFISDDNNVFETGVNEIIPLQIEASGFSNLSYTIYVIKNGNWIFESFGDIDLSNSTTAQHPYQIKPFDISGTYNFSMSYSTSNPYSYAHLQTREVQVINNMELIEIGAPRSYNTYSAGSIIDIYWRSINTSSVNISYSIDGGITWEIIAANIVSDNSYSDYATNYFQWETSPQLVNENKQCRIRIESVSNDNVFNFSEPFTILPAHLKFLSPTEETEIFAGEALYVILENNQSSWLQFEVMDESGYSYISLPSNYSSTGINKFSFIETQSFRSGKNRVIVYHHSSNARYYSEYFNVLPTTGLHLVSFSIDVSNAKINGTIDFNPDLHDVYISGTFQDKWLEPGSADRYKMTHTGSMKFKVNLNIPPGEILYSFFIIPKTGGPTWDHGESDTINCRIAHINQATELHHVWKNYPVYELKLEVAPPEAGIAFGAGFRASGHFSSISTIPNPDYKFINWTSDNQQVLSDSPDVEFRMPPRNVTYTANYVYALNAGAVEHPGTYLYPNPASDKVRIISSLRITEISISDKLGRIILTKSGAFENETELDVSFMNPGVYMVWVVSDGKTEYLKLQVVK